MAQYCGRCKFYRGSEKIPDPKSTASVDSNQPKCAINKSAEKKNYKCSFYEEKENNGNTIKTKY